MSYSRGKYYIWFDGNNMNFSIDKDFVSVPEEAIDVLLYKLHENRKDELKRRINHGKKLCIQEERERGKAIGNGIKNQMLSKDEQNENRKTYECLYAFDCKHKTTLSVYGFYCNYTSPTNCQNCGRLLRGWE